MYAIVEITGKQYKIAKGDKIEVDSMKQEKGKITLENVLLYAKDEKTIEIGNPYVAGATVEAELIDNKRGDKIRVFKMKPKKRYSKTIGHRRELSVLEIKDIKMGAAKAKAKAPAAKKVEEKAEKPAEKAEPKKEAEPKTE